MRIPFRIDPAKSRSWQDVQFWYDSVWMFGIVLCCHIASTAVMMWSSAVLFNKDQFAMATVILAMVGTGNLLALVQNVKSFLNSRRAYAEAVTRALMSE